MSKLKAVLFDFDGTLVDTNQFIFNSWQYMAERVMGERRFDKDFMISTFGRPLDEAMEDAAEKYGITEYSPQQMCVFYREYQRNNRNLLGKPFPGIKELVASLKDEGLIIAIVTSRRNQDTRNGLAENGMDIFDCIVGADDTNVHKPDPEPCLLCCRKLGLDPSETIMVGDSRFDIECGKNAGAKTIFVTWSECTKKEELCGNAAPDYIVDSAEDLMEIIRMQ